MTKNILLFLFAFIGGAVIALAARSALFKPYAEPSAGAGVSGPVAPAVPVSASTAPAASAAAKTVNTVCAICGMPVDASLKPAEYEGKLIGFGCRMCPPKLNKEPARYGPAALENKVVEN